jgi:hypothetical protein
MPYGIAGKEAPQAHAQEEAQEDVAPYTAPAPQVVISGVVAFDQWFVRGA